jgi:hypothetical protein
MERDSDRSKKRDSAKKTRDRSIYSQKAVRAKEALLEKKVSCPPHTWEGPTNSKTKWSTNSSAPV